MNKGGGRMKTIQDFLTFTNLKGARIRYCGLLIFASILYCMIYGITSILLYATDNAIYYNLGIYAINMASSFIYMVILFQFLVIKRNIQTKLKLKSYVMPLILTQSIFFIFLAGGSYATFSFMLQETYQSIYYVMNIILMMGIIFYLPLQIFSMFAIFDEMRNPFIILKTAFVKVFKHYQSVFYSILVLLVLAIGFSWIMNSVYNYGNEFVATTAAIDIMIRNNPFLTASELIMNVSSNSAIFVPCIIAIAYGFIMCTVLVYYYMVMVCIYDEDIRI